MGLKAKLERLRRRRRLRRIDAAIVRIEREVEIARRRVKKGKKLLAALHAQRTAICRTNTV